MTDVNALGGTTSTVGADSGSSDIFGNLGPDAFLQLLVTQMRYQNPLSPSDPTAMMGQLATYAQVESLQHIQQGQAAQATLAEAKLATDLVGSYVDAADATGTTVSGTVVAARFTTDGPVLVLDNGGELTLSALTRVAPGAAQQAAATDTSAPPATSDAGASSEAGDPVDPAADAATDAASGSAAAAATGTDDPAATRTAATTS